MITRNFFNRVAATLAAGGMMLAIFADLAGATTRLNNGDTLNGFIQTNSPVFRYRNQSVRNAPFQSAAGEEYIFNAQQGDTIQISVEVEDGSSLAPILVLTSSQTGNQVAYNDKTTSLKYQVPTTGEYRLLVLAKNNTRGRYTVSLSGIGQGTAAQPPSTQPASTPSTDPRRQLLQREYGLTVLDTCPGSRTSLVVAYFPEYGQTYTYCANPTRLLRSGEYTYDLSSGDLKPGAPSAQGSSSSSQTSSTVATPDARRQLLQQDYGLTVLDNCPASRTSLVVAYFPEYGQTYTYCANPNRFLRAGEYTYDLSMGELKPGAPAAQGSSSSSATAPTSTSDPRRQTLQNDYGLTVLDSCPAATSSLVVVSYPEGSQTYRYCANPNRVFPAGEYTYNISTRKLEPTRKPQQCTVQVGGVCIVR
ncbi:MAG TPA: hypothetical protein DDZ80_16555 [Cyanobacteria bacterium UBA8803]|nr:hypothetical protein [Cyanobacteria bacterium UBA9273]HBL60020.1 hypothetical protein [Cyanobacteria bacterium UBA8803]